MYVLLIEVEVAVAVAVAAMSPIIITPSIVLEKNNTSSTVTKSSRNSTSNIK